MKRIKVIRRDEEYEENRGKKEAWRVANMKSMKRFEVMRRYEEDKGIQGMKKEEKRKGGGTMYHIRRLRIPPPGVWVLVIPSRYDLDSMTVPSKGLYWCVK